MPRRRAPSMSVVACATRSREGDSATRASAWATACCVMNRWGMRSSVRPSALASSTIATTRSEIAARFGGDWSSTLTCCSSTCRAMIARASGIGASAALVEEEMAQGREPAGEILVEAADEIRDALPRAAGQQVGFHCVVRRLVVPGTDAAREIVPAEVGERVDHLARLARHLRADPHVRDGEGRAVGRLTRLVEPLDAVGVDARVGGIFVEEPGDRVMSHDTAQVDRGRPDQTAID